jgi:hypothetical protein
MSVDKMLRDMVADEVARALGPVHAALAELQANGAVVARLAAALGQPIKRGPGRPPKALALSVPKAGRRGRKAATSDGKRACAVIDCGRPARSKGYCAAHYQKYRMLDRTGRLPSDWVADAEPNSVQNLKLPRGRAGAKALAEAKKK